MASNFMTNCFSGSGIVRIGAEVNLALRTLKASLAAAEHGKASWGGQSSEGGRHCTVAPDEPAVKVGEFQELLQLFAGAGCWPGRDSGDLGRVLLQASCSHNKPHEGHSWGISGTKGHNQVLVMSCGSVERCFPQSPPSRIQTRW